MYSIRNGSNDLYYPGDEYCIVTDAKLTEELGRSGSLEITIPAINPYYEKIKQRATELSVWKDEQLIFNGEVREIDVDFWKNKRVYCVGELSYLNDSMQMLQKFEGTRAQIFTQLLNSHNTQVEERKRFYIGAIGSGAEQQLSIISEYESTLTNINKLLDTECYLRIRRESGHRYLDIMPIETYGTRSEQYVEFAENLIDYAVSNSSEDLATACIPLGSSLDESPIEDVTAYVDIKSVNDGCEYVFSQDAVNNFGWIKKVVHFNVLSDPNALKTAGINWLQQNQFEKFSYTLTAVDLSEVDNTVDDYAIGDYLRAISAPHGMDAWLPIRKREIDLLNLANNKITVGSEGIKSLTQSTQTQLTALEEKMPDESAILKTSLRNVSNLINANGENGNISIRQDDNSKPYEILIMDAKSIEESTHAWRLNLSGIGHGTKSAGASEFDWRANVAMLMDGSIDASYITTGYLLANIIRGGILKLGGFDNQSGLLEIYSSGIVSNPEDYNLSTIEVGDSSAEAIVYNRDLNTGIDGQIYFSSHLNDIPNEIFSAFSKYRFQVSIWFEEWDASIAKYKFFAVYTKNDGRAYYHNSLTYNITDHASESTVHNFYTASWSYPSGITKFYNLGVIFLDNDGNSVVDKRVKYHFSLVRFNFVTDESKPAQFGFQRSYITELHGQYSDLLQIGDLIGEWSKDGIVANAGEIAGFKIASCKEQTYEGVTTQYDFFSHRNDEHNYFLIQAKSDGSNYYIDMQKTDSDSNQYRLIINPFNGFHMMKDAAGATSTKQLAYIGLTGITIQDASGNGCHLLPNGNMNCTGTCSANEMSANEYGYVNCTGVSSSSGGSFSGSISCKSLSTSGGSTKIVCGRNGQDVYFYDGVRTGATHISESNIYINGNPVVTQSSDERLKKNVKEIAIDKIREFFNNISFVQYNFKKKYRDDKPIHFGVTAQNIKSVLEDIGYEDVGLITENPEINIDGDNTYVVDYQEIIGLQGRAIQDLYQQISELKEEIKILKGE